jgi:Amt family ammonium transporter
VGGFIGIILCGIFATTTFNPNGVDGLLRGNTHFFLVQCLAVVLSSAWAFAFTLGMLKVIDLITPVKVTEGTEQVGLDAGIHGEKAYLEEGI